MKDFNKINFYWIPTFVGMTILFAFISFGFTQPASNSSSSDDQFAFDLYSHLSSNKGNIFFSPYSLSSALDMAYEGARGATAQEMSAVLHLLSDDGVRRAETASFIQEINRPGKTYELSVANALWAQQAYPFKADYLKIVKDTYFAEARNLDFTGNPEASRVTINHWVSDKTDNHINDLLPGGSITPDTRLVLTDAVYFKGKWAAPFNKSFTKPDTFWLNAGQSVQTDMMQLRDKSFNYTDNAQAQVLELPYQGKDLSMFIVLPVSKDIQSVERILTLDLLKQWQKKMSSQDLNVFLPKFEFDARYEMSGILAGMGMKLAFDRGRADFSGMTDAGGLYIDQVFHKAWIDVDEEGTQAAAATGVVMATMAMRIPQQPKDFRADHPFIFVIQDNTTGHILFMGRVSDPREK